MKNVKKAICHDCHKELSQEEKVMKYEKNGATFYKCQECYENDPVLHDFQNCEVYSRIVGYLRPTSQWNAGKAEEYADRKEFVTESC